MIDRAEKVPKRSQKAILATFWPHFDTCLLHFQTLWTPLDLYTMIFQSIFGCFAKSMHTNFKEPSKSPEHPKCRNTSRCGGVASAFSINSSDVRFGARSTDPEPGDGGGKQGIVPTGAK